MTRVASPSAPQVAQDHAYRRRDIQGLRAVAVILVVAYHARLPVPGGFVGVDVFFVISGFVITAMLHREFSTRGRISFRNFYARRFLRLTPALALLVGFVAVASMLLQSPFGPQQATAQTGIGAMLLSANLVIAVASGNYFATGAEFNPLLNTWSLSVEEQFYLLFPALLALGWLLARWARRPAIAPVLVFAATGASFWLCLHWSMGDAQANLLTTALGGSQSAAFYLPLTRAWEFGFGALLALVLPRFAGMSRTSAQAIGTIGVAMIVFVAFGINDSMAFPGFLALFPVVGTTLVLLAGSFNRTAVSSTLATRPMTFLGDISYSWYLWHWPVIVFAAVLFPATPSLFVLAALASLVPALASYGLLEQPMRRWRPSTTRRGVTAAAVTVGMPIAICGVLYAGAQAGWGVYDTSIVGSGVDEPQNTAGGGDGPNPGSMDDPTGQAAGDGQSTDEALDTRTDLRAAHAAVARGCVNVDLDPTLCSWGPTSPTAKVLVAGDSQAYAIADAVIAASTNLGFQTIVTSRTGCPFLVRESTGSHDQPCRPWQKSVMDFATTTRPEVVVIANRSGGYVRPRAGWRLIETTSGQIPPDATSARESYATALAETVAELRQAGIAVVIIGAVPEMTGYVDQRSVLAGVLKAPPFTVDRGRADDFRAPALLSELALAEADPAVRLYDPLPALCDDRECATRVGDEIRYQDETHLSVAGAMRLASGIQESLVAALNVVNSSPNTSGSP